MLLVLLLQPPAEPIFECLGERPAPFQVYNWGFEGKWMSDQTWQQIQELTGRPLWLGYDRGGWDTAGDEYPVRFWEWPDALVTVFYSPSRSEYELFPHDNIELFADANGDHYGIHPCGGWAVDKTVIDEMIRGNDG